VLETSAARLRPAGAHPVSTIELDAVRTGLNVFSQSRGVLGISADSQPEGCRFGCHLVLILSCFGPDDAVV